MKKTISLLLCLLMLLLLGGCGKSYDFSAHDLPKYGGYICTTSALTCKVITTELGEYIEFDNGLRQMTCYISADEMTIINTSDGMTSYLQDMTQSAYSQTHPLADKWSELSKMDFRYQRTEGDIEIYSTSVSDDYETQEELEYTEYQISMTWEEDFYLFGYYVFENGDIVISNAAPAAINPYYTDDTPWDISIEENELRNSETGEIIPLHVLGSQSGQGVAPNSPVVSGTREARISISLNTTTNRVETIRYSCDVDETQNAVIQLLYDVGFTKPAVTADMTQMSSDDEMYFGMLVGILHSMSYLSIG